MTNIQSLFTVTEVELVYRNKVRPADRRKIQCSSDIYDIMISAWDMRKIDLVEQAYLLLLDRGLHCLGVANIATGGVTACIIDPKIVFAMALKANASSIALAHNHPSGNLKPSNADQAMSRKLSEAGKLLDITFLENMIVTSRDYLSFADEGLMP